MSGGARPGAGRPALPRLSVEETRALLTELAGGEGSAARVALAGRLGVTGAAVRHAWGRGMSAAQAAAWSAAVAASDEDRAVEADAVAARSQARAEAWRARAAGERGQLTGEAAAAIQRAIWRVRGA